MILKAVKLLIANPQQFMARVKARMALIKRRYRRMPRDYRQRFNMTLREWMIYHQTSLADPGRISWMGVTAFKCALDAWMYQEIIYRVRPDIVVEIGSDRGGSTLYFAHLLDLMGHGIVVSVDIDRSRFEVEHERINLVTGDSAAPETVAQVASYCVEKRVLVVHDGGHTKEQVLRDLRAYADFVSVGSYFIVEDSIIDLFNPEDGLGRYWDGPLPAAEQFLRERPDFVVDSECERYLLTNNPRGYLKRVEAGSQG